MLVFVEAKAVSNIAENKWIGRHLQIMTFQSISSFPNANAGRMLGKHFREKLPAQQKIGSYCPGRLGWPCVSREHELPTLTAQALAGFRRLHANCDHAQLGPDTDSVNGICPKRTKSWEHGRVFYPPRISGIDFASDHDRGARALATIWPSGWRRSRSTSEAVRSWHDDGRGV